MSNQEFEESGVVPSGTDAPSSLSGSQPDSSPSQNAGQEDVLIEKILARLEPRLRPMVQSIKDKRLSEFEKRLNSISEQTTRELVESGIPEKEAKELVSKYVPNTPAPVAQTENRTGTTVNVSELQRTVLGLAGLDESDPDVVLLSQKNLAPDQFANEVQGIVTRRRNPPPMSSAMQPAMGTSTHIDRDALFEELEELQMRDPLDRTGRIAKLKSDLGIR